MFALLVVTGISMMAQAQDLGIVAGIRQDSADSDVSGITIKGKSGYTFGGIAKFEMAGPWYVRSGFIYNARNYSNDTFSQDLKFTYFEIPVGVLYKFSDFGGAFLGPAIDMNITNDCGSVSCSGVNSSPIFIQVGASFKFAP